MYLGLYIGQYAGAYFGQTSTPIPPLLSFGGALPDIGRYRKQIKDYEELQIRLATETQDIESIQEIVEEIDLVPTIQTPNLKKLVAAKTDNQIVNLLAGNAAILQEIYLIKQYLLAQQKHYQFLHNQDDELCILLLLN